MPVTTTPDRSNRSIAILHKDYDVAGGGEILAERLGLAFDAPVFAGFVTDANRADLRADVRGLWNGGLVGKLLRRGGLARSMLYKYLYQVVPEVQDYDVVIQSGNEPLWYVPEDRQVTVAYTHSTPRMMFDLHPRLAGHADGRLGFVGEMLGRVLNAKKREQYLNVTKFPDLYVANSDLVARRIRKYWQIPDDRVRVVYPPTPVAEYDCGPSDGDFYLSVNRLDEWKRIGTLVEAFKGLDAELRIAGKGPAEPDLRERAEGHDNIEFLGYIPESHKREQLRRAKAVVYNPLNEDFGMVPVEAAASGTPMVAVNDGFQRYQLTDGQNAVLYDRERRTDMTVRNVRRAVERFESEGVGCGPDDLRAWAEQFGVERFNQEMQAAVDVACELAAVKPKLTQAAPAPDAKPEPAGKTPVEAD